MTLAPPAEASVRTRASFRFVRYASVWEDADILCEALAPRAGGGRLLSIASGGDNALALLTLDPAEVVAVDLSTAQLACLELRIAEHQLKTLLMSRVLAVEPGCGVVRVVGRGALGHQAR